MIELYHCNIFEEIAPQRLILLNQSIRDNLSIHQRPCIIPTQQTSIHSTCINTCNECTSKDIQHQTFYHYYPDYTDASEVFQLDCVGTLHNCRLYQQTEGIPQEAGVKECGHSQVSCQAVWTHSWPALVLWFLFESTLHHPPAYKSLESSKCKQGNESIPEFWLQISFELKDSKRDSKPISQNHAHLPMEKLYPINRFECLQTNLLVDCLKLNSFFIFVELYIPLLIILRVSLSIWTPICHTQP